MLFLYTFLFFFFQAEDGIRDLTVTGVQTCALPIFRGIKDAAGTNPPGILIHIDRGGDWGATQWFFDNLLQRDRKSTRLNSSHSQISYAVFCLKKKKKKR